MEELDLKKLICLLLAALMCGWALADETVRIDHENVALDGEWVDGEMRPNEYHYFPFTIAEAGKLTARVQTYYANAHFELLDADLIPWAGVYISGSQGAPDTEDMVYYLDPGEYYLRSDGDSAMRGDFRIKLMFDEYACDETDGNDDYHGATALANGETMSGVLTERDEYDYYSFALESESQPYLTIHSESDGQQIAVIYDGDMVEIQTIYDLKTYAANLELAAGTYYIAISGAKGAYTLRCAY